MQKYIRSGANKGEIRSVTWDMEAQCARVAYLDERGDTVVVDDSEVTAAVRKAVMVDLKRRGRAAKLERDARCAELRADLKKR